MEFNDRNCVLSAYRWTLYHWFYLSLEEEEFTIDGICWGFTHGLAECVCTFILHDKNEPQEKYAGKHLHVTFYNMCASNSRNPPP